MVLYIVGGSEVAMGIRFVVISTRRKISLLTERLKVEVMISAAYTCKILELETI